MADGTLIFDTKVNEKGFDKGAKNLKGKGKELEVNFSKLGDKLKKYLGFTALVAFAKKAIDFASDIQEVQNVVDTAFGDMAYKMEEFANNSIEAFGMSKLTAKQTGSTFMAMAKGMDIANESASDMALQLTALSGDMASFYNKTTDVTSTALKSVFTGETETLKQFGIVMTEANLEAFRLSQGIETSYKKMTQAQKVQLRYNYVMEQTKLAQGDFTKTQGSWANQTRILSENFKELMGILGSGLIQVLTPVIQVLNIAIKKFIEFSKAIAQVFGGKSNVEAQKEQAEAVKETVKQEQKLGGAIKANDKANKKSLAGFDTIMKLSEKASEGAGGGAGGGEDIGISTPYDLSSLEEADTSGIESKVENINNLLDTLKTKTQEVEEYFGQFAPPFERWLNVDVGQLKTAFIIMIQDVFKGGFDTISMIFNDYTTNILPVLLGAFFNSILPFLTQLLTEIITTFTTLFNTLNGLFQTVYTQGISPALQLIAKIWSGLWDTIYKNWQKWGAPIFEKLRTAIVGIGETWQNIWTNLLEPIWSNFMDNIDWLWTNHLQPFVDNFLDFIGTLVNGALDIYNGFILPVVNWFVETFGPSISNSINLVVDVLGSIVGTIVDVASGIITSLKGIIEFIVGIFTGDWERAWDGIKTFFSGIWEGIVGIVKGAVNLVIDFVNGMISAVRTGLNKVISAINKMSFTVPDWVPGFGGEEWGFNIPKIPEYKIPRLATGTVVPANNGEFLAMLGDNKTETEVVSPLSTMKQAMREVMQELGGADLNADIQIYWNGEEIYNQIEKVRARRGTRLVRGGI